MPVTDDAFAGDPSTKQVAWVDDNPLEFSAVYREHFGFAWASLLRLGVPSASVEDALQDVFVTVHRRLPDFEGRSSTRTWVFGIARRVAFRYRRSAQRADRKLAAVACERTEPPSLEDAVQRKQLGTLLLRALDELDDDKRAAVVLHVLDGMSGPEIARMLDLPVDTAYSRIKAGRRLLRSRLQALGVNTQHGAAIAEAAAQTQPRKGDQRRIAALLAVRLGVGATAKAAAAAVAWKTVAAVVGLGIVTMVSVRVATSEPIEPDPGEPSPRSAAVSTDLASGPSPPVPPTTARDTLTAVPTSVVEAPQPTPTLALPVESPTEPARRASTSASHPTGAHDDDSLRLRDEVRLVESARVRLDEGDAAGALSLLAAHATRFGPGQLRTERAAYRAVALCELGRQRQGRGEGTLFVAKHPDSPLASRVRTACGLAEKKGP